MFECEWVAGCHSRCAVPVKGPLSVCLQSHGFSRRRPSCTLRKQACLDFFGLSLLVKAHGTALFHRALIDFSDSYWGVPYQCNETLWGVHIGQDVIPCSRAA